MNQYLVKYHEWDTGKLKTSVFPALSITHLIFVMEYALGYVPEVVKLVKM